ncbi:TCB2 [Hepatospora eriocheir]|uniref:TCB2 n=1 Tax=Hepatospora eriocheir TaxID=1081669 RepID=A0A1X0QDM8_9MICR|nr:TCB2 [Hepatospora eriocheir]
MDALYYVEILANNLPSSMSKFGFENLKLLQDGDPKHRSKLAKEYFEFNNIKLVELASQLPDLNPIENLWAIIKRRLKSIEFNSINEMKEIVQKICQNIDTNMYANLVNSMSKRIKGVKKAKGDHSNIKFSFPFFIVHFFIFHLLNFY